jgi:hypothetical protein
MNSDIYYGTNFLRRDKEDLRCLISDQITAEIYFIGHTSTQISYSDRQSSTEIM